MRALPREGDDPLVDSEGPDAVDSIRSWLASGAQVVDRRRRFGRHGNTKKLLVVDPANRTNGSERWHTTTSALQRHTVGGALSEIDPEHRRVIALAFLEGRTNREIAATLGVSVATARRRLLAALERLETIVSAAGAWLVAVLVGFSVYVLARLARLTDSAENVQRTAATVTVGVLAAAAVGVVTYMPSSNAPHHGVAPPAPTTPLGTNIVITPDASSLPATTDQTSPGVGNGKGSKTHEDDSTPSGQAANGGAANQGLNGCHGNPTGAPAPTPVGPGQGHLGPPVNPPGKGGCKGL